MMKILVIDKYPLIRIGLTIAIQNHFDNCEIEQSETLELFQSSQSKFIPDLIIQGFPKGDRESNLIVISRARAFYPKAGLIIYDEQPISSRLIEYIQAGADAYLVKEGTIEELISCITDVSNGKRFINNETLITAILNKPFASQKLDAKHKTFLTAHEYEIANYLRDGKKTSWIAQKLGRKSSTISTIKANIFKKLEVDNIIKLNEAIKVLY
jgi:DNA-binding NarL/FixJ family response regulator